MLKKTLILNVCFVILVVLLSSCQAKLKPSDEYLAIDATADHTQEPTVPEWKNAYLSFLETVKDYHLSYALVYLDDDDIPELYLSGDCEATGDGICSYKNGTVVEQRLNRIGGGRYIERGGVLINQNGNMGVCHTNTYRLTEDGFVLAFSALSVERVELTESDKYEVYYDYSIEDKPASEIEYNEAVEAAFDFTQSVRFDENAVEYDVIKQQITDWK